MRECFQKRYFGRKILKNQDAFSLKMPQFLTNKNSDLEERNESKRRVKKVERKLPPFRVTFVFIYSRRPTSNISFETHSIQQH